MMFAGESWPSENLEETNSNGAFRIDVGRKIRDFVDGTAHTAVLGELLSGKFDQLISSTGWDMRGVWGYHNMGCFAYTHLNTPNSSVADRMYWGTCVDAPEFNMPCVDDDYLWRHNQAAARSRHPGGVQVAFADGHVSFFSDEIDLNLWHALATVNGGETVGNVE